MGKRHLVAVLAVAAAVLPVPLIGSAAEGPLGEANIVSIPWRQRVAPEIGPGGRLPRWMREIPPKELPMTRSGGAPAPSSDQSGNRPVFIDGTPPLEPLAIRDSSTFGQSSQSETYRRYEVTDTSQSPYITHGKLIVYGEDGGAWECSATVVTSPSKSLALTAGHCVLDETTTSIGADFIPGYQNGVAPAGVWPGVQAYVAQEWSSYQDESYDYAAFEVAPRSDGALLADVVGSRGIAFSLPREQQFSAFGHPGDPAPFDGERMYVCEGAYLGDHPEPDGYGEANIGMGCDMGQGSSGGGWVTSTGHVNSVVSFGDTRIPEVFFGPYFGDAASRFFTAVSNGQPPPAAEQPPATDTTPPVIRNVSDGPDPFTPNGDGRRDKMRINFTISEDARVRVVVVTRGGALVRQLGDAPLVAGKWFAVWNGRNKAGRLVRSGTYAYGIFCIDAAGNECDPKAGVTTVRR